MCGRGGSNDEHDAPLRKNKRSAVVRGEGKEVREEFAVGRVGDLGICARWGGAEVESADDTKARRGCAGLRRAASPVDQDGGAAVEIDDDPGGRSTARNPHRSAQ